MAVSEVANACSALSFAISDSTAAIVATSAAANAVSLVSCSSSACSTANAAASPAFSAVTDTSKDSLVIPGHSFCNQHIRKFQGDMQQQEKLSILLYYLHQCYPIEFREAKMQRIDQIHNCTGMSDRLV